jgi:hypothetical protein
MTLRSALRFPCLVLPLLLAACGSTDLPRDTLVSQFAEAERDAASPEPAEVVTGLPPLRSDPVAAGGGGDLVWDAEGRLLVTLWAARPGSWGSPGASYDLGAETWVTPAPALESFCRRLFRAPKEEVRLRLEQLLGLPPGAGKDRAMVELWVDPEVLFRPCPDPETGDDHCDLHAPLGDEHRRWFERQEERGRAPDGALWTRLGVTYDWGNPYSEAGLPVLVAPAGSRVEVSRVAATRGYCSRP